jgi:hypothetical protein
MANANYKLREVSASEIAKVFGSARRALRVTRGDEARRCAESVSDALTTPQHMSAASANSMWRDVLGFRAPWESP